MATEDPRSPYERPPQTIEPVVGIITSALGFTRFHLRGLAKVATEWTLIALDHNCRRRHRLKRA